MIQGAPGEERLAFIVSTAFADILGELTSLDVDFLDVVVKDPSGSPIFRLDIVLRQVVLLGCVDRNQSGIVIGQLELKGQSLSNSFLYFGHNTALTSWKSLPSPSRVVDLKRSEIDKQEYTYTLATIP